jgi:hypothetical protein
VTAQDGLTLHVRPLAIPIRAVAAGLSCHCISGGSAGGYTTLTAESRYLDWLIGPYPQEEA